MGSLFTPSNPRFGSNVLAPERQRLPGTRTPITSFFLYLPPQIFDYTICSYSHPPHFLSIKKFSIEVVEEQIEEDVYIK
jgi:hypothetical protein